MRMTAGYKMIGGAIATQDFANRYNVMSAEIEQKENAGYCVEWLKDARHRSFVSYAQLNGSYKHMVTA
jgi:hypothetical protein